MSLLKNKIAVITGGSSEIGLNVTGGAYDLKAGFRPWPLAGVEP